MQHTREHFEYCVLLEFAKAKNVYGRNQRMKVLPVVLVLDLKASSALWFSFNNNLIVIQHFQQQRLVKYAPASHITWLR